MIYLHKEKRPKAKTKTINKDNTKKPMYLLLPNKSSWNKCFTNLQVEPIKDHRKELVIGVQYRGEEVHPLL